jgi:hypothetical protein
MFAVTGCRVAIHCLGDKFLVFRVQVAEVGKLPITTVLHRISIFARANRLTFKIQTNALECLCGRYKFVLESKQVDSRRYKHRMEGLITSPTKHQ